MPGKLESENEPEQLRLEIPDGFGSILQIQQRAQEEIRRANAILEERTRELAEALAIMRATLDSTTDAILVTGKESNVTAFNEKYLEMWRIPREILKAGVGSDVWKFVSEQFSEPATFIRRIDEIATTDRESFDLLELKDGRIFELYSKVLTVDRQMAGR